CKKALGDGCVTGADCQSNVCADGVCCNSACASTCEACNVAGSVGTCSNVPSSMPDPGTCAAPSACDGLGACKKALGDGCAGGAECQSGNCVDSVCCNSACAGTCKA